MKSTFEKPCQEYLLTGKGRKAEIKIQPFEDQDGLKDVTIIIHKSPVPVMVGLKVALPITVRLHIKDDIIFNMDRCKNIIIDDIFEILGFKYGPGIK